MTLKDIKAADRIVRLNLINSITGIKPANLIASISNSGQPNLAIFSSVIHLGSDPPLLGFIMRPTQEVRRDTYQNIMSNGAYTINHISEAYVRNAHYTSAKFDENISEFKECRFTEEYLFDFPAPFVKESPLKIALKFRQNVPIELNGTQLMIGEIQHIMVPDHVVDDNGQINLSESSSVGISGLNSYYQLKKIAQFPYARPKELPTF